MLKDYIIEAFMKTNIFKMLDERANFKRLVDNEIEKIIENLSNALSKNDADSLDKVVESIEKIRLANIQTSKETAIFDVIDAINLVSNSDKAILFVNRNCLDLCCSNEELSKEKILKILNEGT